MLKLSDLAVRPDFRLGDTLVSPARRLVEGPGGRANLQPLIMQVFLMLVDARGQVVTRNALFDQCWGGTYVGDDSLNRTVAKLRQVLAEVAPGLLEIETIPRTGYRVTGEVFPLENPPFSDDGSRSGSGISRRLMIGSAAAAGVSAATGLGIWWMHHSRSDRRFANLIDLGNQVLLNGDSVARAADYYQQAVAIEPGSAAAQGLLALAQASVAEYGGARAGAAVERARRAARAALAAGPKEPNARLALVMLERATLDIATNEDRLRAILADAPANISTMDELWSLLQSAGRSRDALALVERANEIQPNSANIQYPMAQLLWIGGRNAEADRVIDRAMQYWPGHRYVRFARFTIYVYTGRPRAALAMLDDEFGMPHYSPAAKALWRISLAALDQRSPTTIAAARTANVEAAKRDPRLTSQAVMVLSALGEIDLAFDVANQLLLFRRAVEPGPQSGSAPSPAKSTSWRFSPWLFTPPVEPMQADPRFAALCEGIGLTDYWRARGIRPDFELRRG